MAVPVSGDGGVEEKGPAVERNAKPKWQQPWEKQKAQATEEEGEGTESDRGEAVRCGGRKRSVRLDAFLACGFVSATQRDTRRARVKSQSHSRTGHGRVRKRGDELAARGVVCARGAEAGGPRHDSAALLLPLVRIALRG